MGALFGPPLVVPELAFNKQLFSGEHDLWFMLCASANPGHAEAGGAGAVL